MYSRIRSVFVLVFVAASVTWGCGGERVTTSQMPRPRDRCHRRWANWLPVEA